ncbi:MAG: DUF881 domain-containing protein [Fimbriimonas ginsengisoli]|uniref:DUF881 domain-containing protein n=1 Tax=Fimbriimonas ginsengisoli TaxID=1005039 RepID=A0A931LTL8_FIMGI|nr:DUF881 domain-containing protein [Fimbriimonas ginsengisoli]
MFATRISHNSWVVPVTAMCLVLGFMMSLAWVTGKNRETRTPYLAGDQQERVLAAPAEFEARFAKLQVEVNKLRSDKTKLENALASQTGTAKVLNESLQDVKAFAGLTEADGPGVVITLQDSNRPPALGIDVIIHDIDVLRVVNEIWASGADAISVNNHRVASTSSIRCVGPVIHVDGVPIASPVVIRAIGDTDTLLGAMNMPLSVLSEIRGTDPAMVRTERAKRLHLPAYAGPTTRRFATVPKDKK